MTDFFFKPGGNYLVILLDNIETEEVTEAGIVIANIGDNKKAIQRAQALASVIAIGPDCWEGEDRAREGDRITIAQHAGQGFYHDNDLSIEEKKIAERLRIIVDDDVLGVLNPEISLKDWVSTQVKPKEGDKVA